VKISGDGSVSKDAIERAYQAVFTTTEQARRAIAGSAYDTASFRSRAAKFVMDTAASEYATATEGGRVVVQEPGVPGKDNFIEYQDAHYFLVAAYELLRAGSGVSLTNEGRTAFDKHLTGAQDSTSCATKYSLRLIRLIQTILCLPAR